MDGLVLGRVVRKRVVAFCVSATLIVVGGGAAVSFRPNPAGAVGTTHKLSGCYPSSYCTPTPYTGSGTPAVENWATMRFQCNDTTGRYKVVFKNVQVIQPDGVTPWSAFKVGVSLNGFGSWQTIVTLTQNSTSGLFGATQSGRLPDPTVCTQGAGGVGFDVAFDPDSSGALTFLEPSGASLGLM
jgi:hypothetical protein